MRIPTLYLLKPSFQLELSGNCSPYKVQEVEGSGRGLVATRDIAQNEHILTAYPAAMFKVCRSIIFSPYLLSTRSSLQCMNCFLLIPTPLSCPQCGLMVCSLECSTGSLHLIECGLLTSMRTKVGEELWGETLTSIMASVTTIRLLSLQWR